LVHIIGMILKFLQILRVVQSVPLPGHGIEVTSVQDFHKNISKKVNLIIMVTTNMMMMNIAYWKLSTIKQSQMLN